MKTVGRILVEELRELLILDAETGLLYWKRRPQSMFRGENAKRMCAVWNSQFADKEAFAAPHLGYRRSRLLNRSYYAHHIVWALYHGRWPVALDHDNQNRSDNRPTNLVERTQAQNMKNQPRRRNCKSGVMGVTWSKAGRCWVARASGLGGERVYLGRFGKFEDAVAARRKAEDGLGYHMEHGKREAVDHRRP